MKFSDVKCSLVECGLASQCSSWGDGPPPVSPGVYAFYVDSECVYVGQSKNMKRRTDHHPVKNKWPNPDVFWVECKNHVKMERFFIEKLKPVCNLQTRKRRVAEIYNEGKVTFTPTDANLQFLKDKKKRNGATFTFTINEALAGQARREKKVKQ